MRTAVGHWPTVGESIRCIEAVVRADPSDRVRFGAQSAAGHGGQRAQRRVGRQLGWLPTG